MDIDEWIDLCRTPDVSTVDRLLDASRVVYLGETNHFVHEKVEFRLYWLERLAARRNLVVGEELGWCDGRRVADYILKHDDAALDRAATFGYRGHLREDRDDAPKGIFGRSPYPYALMRAEHTRLYHALREVPGIVGYFGFDVDSPGGGYDDLPTAAAVARVPGESREQEAAHLESLALTLKDGLAREDLLSLVESLRYTSLVQSALTYDEARPAMAYREETMKRRVEWQLRHLPADATLVLMAHAFHLAKCDADIERQGVGRVATASLRWANSSLPVCVLLPSPSGCCMGQGMTASRSRTCRAPPTTRRVH